MPIQISEAARALQASTDPRETLDLAVRLAVQIVPGCDEAAVTIVEPRTTLSTAAGTSEVVFAVDKLQHDRRQGPCLTALHEEPVVSVPDVEAERRWPEWARATVERTPVRSMLCFRLFSQERRVGALNLYALEAHAFTGADVDAGVALAAQISLATTFTREVAEMRGALDSRNLIGQAQGILMERYGIDAGRALAVLKRVSQHSNRKLISIARELVETRALPVTQPDPYRRPQSQPVRRT